SGGQQTEGGSGSPGGEQQSQGAAAQGKQHTLGEQLAGNARAGGTERGADGELSRSSGRSRQQHTGYGNAGDQQHTSYRRQENQNQRANVRLRALVDWSENGSAALI